MWRKILIFFLFLGKLNKALEYLQETRSKLQNLAIV